MKTTQIDVATLELCDRTRVRKIRPNENSDVVEEYAEAYRCGLIVEPLDVFVEKGTERYVVADGEHRLLALQRAKIKTVEVRLHEGDEVAALDFAIGCNHAHGVRRTKADKYHAFERIMDTRLKEQYQTDTQLSEKIGVAKRTIADYKVQWRNSESGGDREVQRKKQRAREDAKKNTREGLEARTELNGKKHAAVSKRETPKPPPKKSEPSGWTAEDEKASARIEAALSELDAAWVDATRPAQINWAAEIAQRLRSMR